MVFGNDRSILQAKKRGQSMKENRSQRNPWMKFWVKDSAEGFKTPPLIEGVFKNILLYQGNHF